MWAIEVQVDDDKWVRMQVKYKSREVARSWLQFAKKAWCARHARTVEVTHD